MGKVGGEYLKKADIQIDNQNPPEGASSTPPILIDSCDG